MKISDFASMVTKLEGGKQNLTVAQVSEVLKIVNGQLWGIPYWLIKAKRGVAKVTAIALITLMASGCATIRPTPIAASNCPVAMIEVKPAIAINNFASGARLKRFPSAIDTIFGG